MKATNMTPARTDCDSLLVREVAQAASGIEIPAVSVVAANYNGAQFLPALLRSLTRQSLSAIEILVIDDASTDGSIQIVREAAAKDSRIHLECLAANSGPAAARNRGLAKARGEWIAIVDCDDLVHPFRFERLLELAKRTGAGIVADNLFVFHSDGTPPKIFLPRDSSRAPWRVSLAEYIERNQLFSAAPGLGYLKPMIQRSAIERCGLRYDEQLRIGEDYDFILRALAAGLQYWIDPFPSYCYRKHSASISHRLGNRDIEAMEAADRMFLQAHPEADAAVKLASDRRFASLQKAKSWNNLVAAIKARKLLQAMRTVFRNPRTLPLLALPIRARAARLIQAFTGRTQDLSEEQTICLISRQRLMSANSGSARYVLSLVEALAGRGCKIHLIQPSPSVFGRLPVMRRTRDARLFATIRVRGGVFIGPFLFALNPRIWFDFAEAVIRRIMIKAGFALKDRPAPYSVAVPWSAEDLLFTARYAPPFCRATLFDYGFQTVAAPYLPGAPGRTFAIMHDLISSRHAQFERIGHPDSLPAITEAQEIQLLTGADAVIAIQPSEAAAVQSLAPRQTVICAPMAVKPVPGPQPGDGRHILFVGTNTAPNVAGLIWFLNEVWPLILKEMPLTEFWIAGSAGRALPKLPGGVKGLGVVGSLEPFYREAGAVISPLLTGSGLKIKFVEALAHGKAIVATSSTLQGVEHLVDGFIEPADCPEAFASQVNALLASLELRKAKASQALALARKYFGTEACYGEFLSLAVG